jgi:hypothetical protein
MRFFTGLLLLAVAGILAAQTPEDADVTRARMELLRVQGLVEAGALPQAQLDKARAAVQDAEDGALLRRSLYQQDMTQDQADAMVAAAARQLERRKQAFDEAKTLVESGAAAQISLSPLLVDLDFARKQVDLAETRAKIAREITEMAEAEAAVQTHLSQLPAEPLKIAERYDGDGIFTPSMLLKLESAFALRFGHTLPITANGETAVHRAMGFDHRGRVDVGVHPDQPEGVWLREYLTTNRIPYFAFRAAVPGKATGAHIHLGPISGPVAK